MKSKISIYKLCLAALAVCINLVGGELALLLRLPIYLDSIGTILVGALCGPWYGLLPGLLSGILMGITSDIYSLYFAPVGMIVGMMTGFVWRKMLSGSSKKWKIFPAALIITVPGTIVSSLICAGLFGGITSSGSTILVQLLAKTPLGLTASVFLVQILTDYLDRLISIILVMALLKALPKQLLATFQKKGGQ